MKKQIIILTFFTFLLAITSQVIAGISITKSFKVCATIPKSIKLVERPYTSIEKTKLDMNQDFIHDETLIARNGKTILLQTSVLK